MRNPNWYYNLMIEHVVANMEDGATFEEAVANFDLSSEVESHEIFEMNGKTVADLKKDVKEA